MRRFTRWLWAALLLAALCAIAAAQQAPPPYAARLERMVRMRDGVKLATDVYLPDGSGPWPALLIRTPYSRRAIGPPPWSMGDGGYAVVTQDVRGRFDSEGQAIAFFDDGWGQHQDGYDTVAWILKQRWCNGKIGTFGASATGITQYLLAGTDPPGVVCQNIIVGSPSMYQYGARPGGVYLENLFTEWIKATKFGPKTLEMMRDHAAYDDAWATVDLIARLPNIHKIAPAVHVGGWYDIFNAGTVEAFAAMQAKGRNQWLVMGPWGHGVGRTKVGELVFPDNAKQIPAVADMGEWTAHWLKGKDNGIERQPRVQYYVMGAIGEEGAPGNEWRTAPGWPIPATKQRWHLQAGGQLALEAPGAEKPDTYHHDPNNPVPTIGGNNLLIPAGPMDQTKAEQRKDVLTFTSAALGAPLEVTGDVIVRLWVASTATDAHFMAKLCDVYPDGRSMLVLDAARAMSFRESYRHPTPIKPGKVYQITVNLGPTSIIFNKGHRIRLDIASSNSPRFEVCPLAATQTVFHDKNHPSALVFPVVEQRSK
jgi:hypothetical protein